MDSRYFPAGTSYCRLYSSIHSVYSSMLIFIHWNDEAFLTVDGIRMDLSDFFRFYTENDIISFDCRDIIIRIIDRDDPAIVGGVAYLDGQPVTVIGIQKGKDFKDCMKHNYGMPSPEGYRKAIRLMKQAEKFGRPVITFVNTAGAYCGMEAEERGQGEAIARNLYEMSALKVPVLCIMIGEGGSGGALALAVGNEVWMMENATYCVLSPEGFASILWKDGKRAKEAAEVMKITAQDLKELQVVDDIIPEFGGADEDALTSIANYMKGNMKKFLKAQNGK